MKQLLIFSLCFAISNNTNAQLTANAGGEKHVCSNDTLTYVLGGAPTATGGTLPYTYAWYMKTVNNGVNSTTNIAGVLNDTTLANPQINNVQIQDTIKAFVKITDALNNTAIDSAIVIISGFTISLGGNFSYNLQQGDSMQYTGGVWANSTHCPCSYIWSPSIGLSDTSLLSGFWIKPNTNITYSVTVIDAIGCKAVSKGPDLIINILPNSLKEDRKNAITLYPNPTTNYVKVTASNSNITLCNSIGVQLLHTNTTAPSTTLDLTPYARGIYYVRVTNNNETQTFKVIKED